MTIHNGRGITSYPRFMTSRKEGAPTRLKGLRDVVGAANPILVQLHEILIGGTASDGNYVTTITDDQTGESWTVTTVRATTPTNNDDIAAQHAADINATEALNGVVVAEVDGTTAEQVNLTFLHPGITYTVVCTETTATGTITPTKTQTAGGSAQKLGRAVLFSGKLSGQWVIGDLTSTSLQADVKGMTLRPQAAGPHNLGSVLNADVDAFLAGEACDVIREGYAAAKNVSSVAASAGDAVHVVRSTTGGDELGQFRADADGAAHVVGLDPTEVNATRYQIQVTLIDEATGKTVTVANAEYLSDASATASEISTGLKTDLDTLPIVTTYGVTTALAGSDPDKTLNLTAPVGYRLIVDSIGDGTVTIADVTAFAMYTIRMDAWTWEEDVAAGASGEVYFSR